MPGTAIASPTFQPAMRLITAITLVENASITTNIDHDYLVGLIVRIYVPFLFGTIQANQKTGTIIEITGTDSFIVDIDTRGFDTFAVPNPEPWYLNRYAEVVPVGQINSLLNQAVRNVL